MKTGITGRPQRKGAFVGLKDLVRPQQLPSLAAWYDVSDLSSLIYDGSNRVALVADKSGNSSVNVLALNGVAGNNATTPSAAPLLLTGNMEIEVDASAVDWTPAANYDFISKLNAGTNSGYSLSVILTTGIIRFTIGTGAALVSYNSSVAPTVSDLSRLKIKVEYVADDGAGGSSATFYTATPGEAYVQLGTPATSTNRVVATDATALYIGCYAANTTLSLVNGNVYRATIRDGVGGTAVFDANFSTASKLTASFTESSSNAATVTVNTSGATGARICGARDLYQGVVANQPVLNVWSGTNYGYLNGVAGNYFSTPDSAAVSITGDIDLRVLVAMADWTPSASNNLIGKDTVSGDREWELNIKSVNGFPDFFWWDSGGTLRNVTSTVAPTVSDLGATWIRVTLDVDNGTGGHLVSFYQSSDGSSWTLLNSGNAGAFTTSIRNQSSPVSIGAVGATGATAPASGIFYRAQIYNGIAGTLVFDFNPAAYTSGTTFPDSSANAATITLNGGSTIVTKTYLYFDGSNDDLKAAAFALAQPETVYFVGSQVTWTLNDGIYGGNALGKGMDIYQSSVSPNLAQFAGTPQVDKVTSFAVSTNAILTAVFNGASSLVRVNRDTATSTSCGTESGNGYTLGAARNSTAPANITVSEILIYNAAQNITFWDRVFLWLARKWSIPIT